MNPTITNGEQRTSAIAYDQFLPEICARCGESATTRVEYQVFEEASKGTEAATMAGNFVLAAITGLLFGTGGPVLHARFPGARGRCHKVGIPFLRQTCRDATGGQDSRRPSSRLRDGRSTCPIVGDYRPDRNRFQRSSQSREPASLVARETVGSCSTWSGMDN